MARQKQTPRKRTGPKGVPRHQLAPRSDQASSSRSPPQQEVDRLSAELTEVMRERMYNVMEIGKLKAQLAKEKQATENCEAMLSRMVEERNAAIAREEEARSTHRHELTRMNAKLGKVKYLKDLYVKMAATVTAQRDVAWQREDQLQLEKLELAYHLDTVNDLAMQYRDIAFDLYHQLHPPPGEGEMDTDGELADDGEPDPGLSDEEESDPDDHNPGGNQDDGNDDPGYSSGHTD